MNKNCNYNTINVTVVTDNNNTLQTAKLLRADVKNSHSKIRGSR